MVASQLNGTEVFRKTFALRLRSCKISVHFVFRFSTVGSLNWDFDFVMLFLTARPKSLQHSENLLTFIILQQFSALTHHTVIELSIVNDYS